MQRLSSCLIVAAVAAVALPALAQQPPPNPNGPPPSGQARIWANRSYEGMMPGIRADYENFLDAAAGNNLPAQPLARIDLANRVSTLIELGRCTDARNEAREAGDRQMALRARQMCPRDRNAG
ncbi:hypothetical protein GCM10009116_23070 [Brevundimonas basaltis]|uniref:Secreted protein n=1 Tax=Brevundimonas basaltis TaxID=472166 RepID=A0A7W8MH84_9CAUL|nr:hypothetical protein [Brevundimonas basaltis]MBB5293023.1 hypothetical protein [Brevundimonas basaltis]